MTTMRATLGLVVISVLLMEVLARANDWPQWRGPNRDGHSRETGLLEEWPKGGPRLAWQVQDRRCETRSRLRNRGPWSRSEPDAQPDSFAHAAGSPRGSGCSLE